MSIETIVALSDEVGAEARRRATQPLVPTPADVERWRELRTDRGGPTIPNIGSYRPDGWELIDDLFCDKSGTGAPDEPALTLDQFCDCVEDLFADEHEPGLAIIEEGEFQLVVGVFRRTTDGLGAFTGGK